ncbi:EAL domain-containing protein [Tepidicaulis sp.]|uniref:EAL domain-containing protein n=1 Tax=Tepidicaulis sp. TaxID=1920809 RepID=UPI003B591380
MPRFVDVLLIAIYALVAAASSAALIQYGGLQGPFAWLAGFQVFLVMGLIQTMTARRVEQRRMDELIAYTNSISRDLEITEEKLAELLEAGAHSEEGEDEAISLNVRGLQERVAQLAEELERRPAAQKEERVEADVEDMAAGAAQENSAADFSKLVPGKPEAGLDAGETHFDLGAKLQGRERPSLQLVSNDTQPPLYTDAELLDVIKEALEKNRLDLYLQPVVNLPQRQTCYYEGLTRLRGPRGEVIMPADYIRVAAPAGLMPIIDNMQLLRSVQVVRQMSKRGKDTPIFCNISSDTLSDTEFFPQFIDYLRSTQELTGKLVFEIAQETMLNAGVMEMENLRDLASAGFHLSMDKIDHLRMDFHELHGLGFRFVKVGADLLFNASMSETELLGDIHPEDLKELLRRNGISLIAERIEDERTVIDLLDFDIDYGQGYLFSRPRPVRRDMIAA